MTMRRIFRAAWWVPLALAAIAAAVSAPVPTNAAGAPSEGLVCTSSASASFVLTAKTGYVTTPDLNSVFMWSYANGNGNFQYPGPFLCVNEGDRVTITLRNTLPAPTSIVFPGITGVQTDSAPAQPDPATQSLTKAAAANTGSVTYTFTAGKAGTYTYESGTDPQEQVRMGLVGALIVRPATRTTSTTPPPACRPRSSARRTSTCTCCRRSTPTCTRRSSRASRST
jgi:FtsP/CotA-like multicopper oxidase with cupredoxin domain